MARAASLAARAKRAPRPDLVPDLLPGAMDADVDLPSDVDSVPSEPAAGENLLAEVLGPRRVPLRGAARAQPYYVMTVLNYALKYLSRTNLLKHKRGQIDHATHAHHDGVSFK